MTEWEMASCRGCPQGHSMKDVYLYERRTWVHVNATKYFIVDYRDGTYILKKYDVARGDWSKPYPTDVGPIHDLEAAKVACVLLNGGGE